MFEIKEDLDKDEFICPYTQRICSTDYCESAATGAEDLLNKHHLKSGCSKLEECEAYKNEKNKKDKIN